MTASTDTRQRFVDAVRSNLDATMAEAGFPLNDVYEGPEDPPNRNISVLYEGIVSAFLTRYPGLDPAWDEEWRSNGDGCVDLWIKWSEADDKLEANLEHWDLRQLAERFGDESSVMEVEAAMRGPGDIEKRVEVLTTVIKGSMRAASSSRRRPGSVT